MEFNARDTAVVITDPQNDFLSPQGVTWPLGVCPRNNVLNDIRH